MNHFYTYQKSDELVLKSASTNYIYINYDVENAGTMSQEEWKTFLNLDSDNFTVKYLGAPDAQKRTGITAETSATAHYLLGTDYGDSLTAGIGVASTLDGGKGNDTMNGSTGADVFYIDSAQDVVSGGKNTVTDAAGNKQYDTVRATANVDFVAAYSYRDNNNQWHTANRISGDVGSVELLGSANLNVTGSNLSTVTGGYQGAQNALNITGNAGSNQLTGTRYNDTIDAGRGGSAIMRGGAGNDLYIVRNRADQVQGEDVNGGDDTVQTYGVNVNLGTTFRNVEHVVNMGGAVSMTGAGNGSNLTAAEEFTAGAFGDTIDGKGGADTITRGAGADVVYYYGTETVNATGEAGADLADTLILSKTPTAFAAEGLNFVARTFGAVSMESGGRADIKLNLRSAHHDMTITGNAGNNFILAGSGNDVIYGGGGSDTISAGKGDDYVEAVLTTVEDYQTTAGDTTTYRLKGGAGQDTLSFGAGNQTIAFQSHDPDSTATDKVTTFTQKGLKQTVSVNGRPSVTAADSVAVGVTGFEGYDGGAGNDSLDARLLTTGILLMGGAGNDTLIGGAGDDTLVADGGSDMITTGKGKNQIRVTADAKGSIITVTDYARRGNTEGTEDYINDSALSGWERSVTKVNADVQIVWTNPDKTYEKVTMRLLNADVSDVRWLRPDSSDGVTFNPGAGEDAAFTGGVFYAAEKDANTAWTVTTKAAGQKIVGGSLGDTLSDAEGMASIDGGAGDDAILLRGVSGGAAVGSATSLTGGAGADRFELESLGGENATTVDAGDGDDTVVVNGLTAATGISSHTIAGGQGTDTLRFVNSRGVTVSTGGLSGGTLTLTGMGLADGASVTADVTDINVFEGTAAADNVDLSSYATGVTYRTGGGNDRFTGATVGGNTVIVDGAFTSAVEAGDQLALNGGSSTGTGNTLKVELTGASLTLGSEANDMNMGSMALTHNRQVSGALTNFRKVALASSQNAGASVTVNAYFDVNHDLEVAGGNGADTFTIHGTDAGSSLTLSGGKGDDTFILDDFTGLAGLAGTLALKGGEGANSLSMAGVNKLTFGADGKLTELARGLNRYTLAANENAAGLYLEGIRQYVTMADNAEFSIGAAENGLQSGSVRLASSGDRAVFTVNGAVAAAAALDVRGGAGANDALVFLPDLPPSQTDGNLLYLTMQSDGSFTAAYADTDDASTLSANITGSGIEKFTLGGGRIDPCSPNNTAPRSANVFNAALYTGGLEIVTGENRDVVTGGKGDDTFHLSKGNDVITLNGGNDRLVLTCAALGSEAGDDGSVTTIKGKFTATVDGRSMLQDDDLIANHYVRTVTANTTLGSRRGIKVVYSKEGVDNITLLFEDNKLGDISNKALAGATLNLRDAGWTGEIQAGAETASIIASSAVGNVTVTGGTHLSTVDFSASAGSFVYTDAGDAHAQSVTGTNIARAARGSWDNMIAVNGGLSSGTVEVTGGVGRDSVKVDGTSAFGGSVVISTGRGDDRIDVAGGDGTVKILGNSYDGWGTSSSGTRKEKTWADYDGNDTISVTGTITGGDYLIEGGLGNDIITLADISGGNVAVHGRMKAKPPKEVNENDNDTITLGVISGGTVNVEGNGGDNVITVKAVEGGAVTLGGGAAKTTITVTEGISGGTVHMDGDEGVNIYNMGAVSGSARVEARGYNNSVNTFNIASAAAGTVVALYGDGRTYTPDSNTDTLNFTGATGAKARFDAGVSVSPLDGIDANHDYAIIGLSGVEAVNGTALADEFVLDGFIGSKLTINGKGGGDSFTASADWDGSIVCDRVTGADENGDDIIKSTTLAQTVTVNFTGGGNTAAVGAVTHEGGKLTVSSDGKKDADGRGDTLVIDGTAGISGMTPTGVGFELNSAGQLTGAALKNGMTQAGSLLFSYYNASAYETYNTASHVATVNIYDYALKAASGSSNVLDAHAYRGALTLSADNGTNLFIGGGSTATRMTGGSNSDTFRLTGNVGLVDGGEGTDIVTLADLSGTSYTLADGAEGTLTLSGGVTATLKSIEALHLKAGTTLMLNAAAGIPVITLAADAGRKDTLQLGANLAGNTVNVNGFNLADDVITGGTLTGTIQDGETTIRTYSLTDGGSVDVILNGVQDHSADSAGDTRGLAGGAVYFGSAHADTVTLSLGATGSFVDLKGNDEAGRKETLTVTLDGAQTHYGASTLRSSGVMAAGATSVLAVDNAGFAGGAALTFANAGGVATLSRISLQNGSGDIYAADITASGFTAYRGTADADTVTATGGALAYETGGGADTVTGTSANDSITVTTLVEGTNINTGSGTDTIYIRGVDSQYDSGTTLFKATGRGILSFAGDTPVQMEIWNSGTRADITMAGHAFQNLTLNGFTQFAGSGGNDAFTFASWANNPTFDGGDGDDTAEFRYLGSMADKKFAVFQVGSANGGIQVERGYRGNTVGSYVFESGYVTLQNMETLQGTAGTRDMFRIKELNSVTAAPTYKAASNGENDNVRIRGIAAATRANAVTLKAEGSADRLSDMEVSFFGSYGDEVHTIQGVRLELKKDDVWAVLGDLGYDVYTAGAATSRKQARLDLTNVYGLGGTDARDLFVLHSDYEDFFAGNPDYALILDGGTGVDTFTMAAPETGTAWGNQTLTFGAGDDAEGARLTNAGNHTTRFISVEQFNIVGDSVTINAAATGHTVTDGVFVLDWDTAVTADALAADGTVAVDFSAGVDVGANRTFTYTGSAAKADTVTLGEVSGGTKFSKYDANPTRYLKMDAGAGAGDALILAGGSDNTRGVSVHIDGSGSVVALGYGASADAASDAKQNVLLSGFEEISGGSVTGTQFRVIGELERDLTLKGAMTSNGDDHLFSEGNTFAVNTVKADAVLTIADANANDVLKLNKKTDDNITATVHMDAGDSANNRVTFAYAGKNTMYGTVNYGNVKRFVGNVYNTPYSHEDNKSKGTNVFKYTAVKDEAVLSLTLGTGYNYNHPWTQLNVGSDAHVMAMDTVLISTAAGDANTTYNLSLADAGALTLHGDVNLDLSGMANGGTANFSSGLNFVGAGEYTANGITGTLTFTGSANGADTVTLGEVSGGTEFDRHATNPTRYLQMDAGEGTGDTLNLQSNQDIAVNIDGNGNVVALGYGVEEVDEYGNVIEFAADAAADARKNVLLSNFETIVSGSNVGTQFRLLDELARDITLKRGSTTDGADTYAVNTVKAGAVLTIADANANDVLKLNKKTDDDITATVIMDKSVANGTNNKVTFAKGNGSTDDYGTVDYGTVKTFIGNPYNTPYSHSDSKSKGINVFKYTAVEDEAVLSLTLGTGYNYNHPWTQLNVGSDAHVMAMDTVLISTAAGDANTTYNLSLADAGALTLHGDVNLDLSGMANGGTADFSSGLNFVGAGEYTANGITGTLTYTGSATKADTVTLGRVVTGTETTLTITGGTSARTQNDWPAVVDELKLTGTYDYGTSAETAKKVKVTLANAPDAADPSTVAGARITALEYRNGQNQVMNTAKVDISGFEKVSGGEQVDMIFDASQVKLTDPGLVLAGGIAEDTYMLHWDDGAHIALEDTDVTYADTVQYYGFTRDEVAATGDGDTFTFSSLVFQYNNGMLNISNGQQGDEGKQYLNFTLDDGTTHANANTVKDMLHFYTSGTATSGGNAQIDTGNARLLCSVDLSSIVNVLASHQGQQASLTFSRTGNEAHGYTYTAKDFA